VSFVAVAGESVSEADGASPATKRTPENSDVLLAGSVAVAVTYCPAIEVGEMKLKLALPLPSVATFVAPRKRSPSPCYGLPAKPAGFAPGSRGVFIGPHTTPVRSSSDAAIDAKVRSYA
jgi:hypothetical protein